MNHPALWKALGVALIATIFIYLGFGLFANVTLGLWLPIILLIIASVATVILFKYWPHFGILRAAIVVSGIVVFLIGTGATTIEAITIYCSHRSLPVVRAQTQDSTTHSLTALQIMDHMKSVYRTCSSYSDTGRYESGLGSGSFKTAFIRPDRFRFEYQSDSLLFRYLVWGKGNQGEFRSTLPFESTRMRLDYAVASATGVSEGTAHLIPCLLLKEVVGGYTVDDMTEVHRLPDATIDGRDCYCIAGNRFGNTTLWLEKRTFLILRVDEEGQVTTYQPMINEQVSEQALRTDW